MGFRRLALPDSGSSVDIREDINFLIRSASCSSTAAVYIVQKLLTIFNVVFTPQYLVIYSTYFSVRGLSLCGSAEFCISFCNYQSFMGIWKDFL
jgi:hypothetical protein